MAELSGKEFLEKHRTEIISKTRSPESLSDFLLQKNFINQEMFSTINSQKTRQDKMREIFTHLNNNNIYQNVYNWLKLDECDFIKELGNSSFFIFKC